MCGGANYRALSQWARQVSSLQKTTIARHRAVLFGKWLARQGGAETVNEQVNPGVESPVTIRWRSRQGAASASLFFDGESVDIAEDRVHAQCSGVSGGSGRLQHVHEAPE